LAEESVYTGSSHPSFNGGSYTSPSGFNHSRSSHHSTKPKFPLYEGEGNFKSYLISFEMVAEANGIDPVEWGFHLASCLRKKAQDILGVLTREQRNNYHELVLALFNRFEPPNQTEIFRAQLKQRTRKPRESASELAHDIKFLVLKAYPLADPSFQRRLELDSYYDSLKNTALAYQVFARQPKTIDQAVQLTLEYESFHDSRPKFEKIRSAQAEDRPTRSDGKPSRHCDYCDRSGHTEDYCWTKKRDQESAEASGGSANSGSKPKSGSGKKDDKHKHRKGRMIRMITLESDEDSDSDIDLCDDESSGNGNQA